MLESVWFIVWFLRVLLQNEPTPGVGPIHKARGCSLYHLGFKKVVLVVVSSFSCRVLTQKEYNRRYRVFFRVGYLTGEKHFMPRSQNRILLTLRGSFQNF